MGSQDGVHPNWCALGTYCRCVCLGPEPVCTRHLGVCVCVRVCVHVCAHLGPEQVCTWHLGVCACVHWAPRSVCLGPELVCTGHLRCALGTLGVHWAPKVCTGHLGVSA